MRFLSRTKILALAAVVAFGLAACSNSGDTGRLSMSLTDKPSDDYNAVYVTIKDIAVHAAGDAADSWTTVLEVNRTINLLELSNGIREQLGIVSLAAGDYTQMRLMIGDQKDGGTNILGQPHPFANYVIDTNDNVHEMKIPSGFQTGVKLVQGFTINENSTTELTFDFDASKSVVRAGNSGNYLLKPTIQVVDTATATVLSGTVTTLEGQTSVGVGGALVSVQIYDEAAADLKDQVLTKTSTFTADTDADRGQYKFFFAVPAGGQTFDIVASKLTLVPGAARLAVQNGTAYTQDFALDAATQKGTVNVTITGATADVPVTLSFRQNVTLGTDAVVIEVFSVSVVNGNPDPIVLPAGEYSLVSWTDGKVTQQAAVSVTDGGTAAVTVAF